jgi:hypothetical protein
VSEIRPWHSRSGAIRSAEQDPLPEQRETGASVHLPLQSLTLVLVLDSVGTTISPTRGWCSRLPLRAVRGSVACPRRSRTSSPAQRDRGRAAGRHVDHSGRPESRSQLAVSGSRSLLISPSPAQPVRAGHRACVVPSGDHPNRAGAVRAPTHSHALTDDKGNFWRYVSYAEFMETATKAPIYAKNLGDQLVSAGGRSPRAAARTPRTWQP